MLYSPICSVTKSRPDSGRRLCIVMLCLLLLLPALPVFAASAPAALFAVSAPTEPLKPGDSFTVTLTPQSDALSAFVLTAEQDSSIVSAKAEFSGLPDGDHTYSTAEEHALTLVYAAAEKSMPAEAAITLTFRTSKEISAGDAAVLITIQDASDPNARPLLAEPESYAVSVPFLPAPSADCTLLSLKPSAGQLSPAFRPDVTEYTLEVPFSCTSLSWDTVPADGAVCRVNRKNLGAGGSTTDFLLTVTAADGKTKAVYTVHVTRLKKGFSGQKTGSGNTENPTDGSNIDTAASTPTASSPESAAVQPGISTVTVITQNAGMHPLSAAAIVLFSAAAGMLLVLAILFLQRNKNDPKS